MSALFDALGAAMTPPQDVSESAPRLRRASSRDAIVDAAERLFLQRGFGAVSMDDLAEAAGVARRTLYNQFASKEEIFREMLGRVSGQLEHAIPAVLRRIAQAILDLHKQPEYLGFLRMVAADARQFPWIAEAFAGVLDPYTERLERYLAHLTSVGLLDCRNPTLAGHQFAGMLNEVSLWPWMLSRERLSVSDEELVDETVRMFLQHYGRPRSAAAG
jgi:AcrR family transcriptional regulator